MTEWGVFLVIGALVSFVMVFVKVGNTIQKNTDSNDALKETLSDLKSALNTLSKDNKEEHKTFRKDISDIKEDVAVLKTKHDADIQRLEEHNE